MSASSALPQSQKSSTIHPPSRLRVLPLRVWIRRRIPALPAAVVVRFLSLSCLQMVHGWALPTPTPRGRPRTRATARPCGKLARTRVAWARRLCTASVAAAPFLANPLVSLSCCQAKSRRTRRAAQSPSPYPRRRLLALPARVRALGASGSSVARPRRRQLRTQCRVDVLHPTIFITLRHRSPSARTWHRASWPTSWRSWKTRRLPAEPAGLALLSRVLRLLQRLRRHGNSSSPTERFSVRSRRLSLPTRRSLLSVKEASRRRSVPPRSALCRRCGLPRALRRLPSQSPLRPLQLANRPLGAHGGDYVPKHQPREQQIR